MKIGVLLLEGEFSLGRMPLRGFAVYEASNADEVIALLELHEEKKSEPCSPGILICRDRWMA
jgi:hypothetical protein